jgi:shikimate kinase
MRAKATVFGAISIVNAIATGKGATLGINSTVEVIVSASGGRGIYLQTDSNSMSSKLVNKVVEMSVPRKDLEKNRIEISLKSQIPTGYGLKSSSAISSAISLACHKLFRPKYTDTQVLLAGVEASIAAKVSMTGAYDDACACYYGGTVVTDNYKRKIVRMERTPHNIAVAIFVPRSRKRGNIKHLRTLGDTFQRAWDFAKDGDYWNAMVLNGLAGSTILNSDPSIVSRVIEAGALGVSVSGNGPAIAAVAKKERMNHIKKVFACLEGRTITAQINNKKAEVHEL